jgi:uncharacterized protein YjbJ (UPF0337 family)
LATAIPAELILILVIWTCCSVRWWRLLFFGSTHCSAACGIFALNGTAAHAGTLSIHQSHTGVVYMDREHVKGAADKAKGAIKDAAGKVTGDKELQTEGKLDKAKGDAHNLAGDLKDAVRKGKE